MKTWPLLFIFAVLIFCGIVRLDRRLAHYVSQLRKQIWLRRFFEFFSDMFVIVLLLFVFPEILVAIHAHLDPDFPGWYSAAALALGCSLALGTTFSIKHLIGRRRPFGNQTYLGSSDSSFPSAHTAGTFASAFLLMRFWPEAAPLVFALALLVALSRIYLELHFFSDVVGGVLIAYLVSQLILATDFMLFIGF